MPETRQPLDRAEAPLEVLRSVGLSLRLDRSGDRLDLQISAMLGAAVTAGRLADGERLPSARRLAAALAVSRNTVASAYADLVGRGLAATVHGAGTFVCAAGVRRGRPRVRSDATWLGGGDARVSTASEGTIDLRLRAGTIVAPTGDAWRRAWRLATATVSPGYGDPRGPAEVRVAIADYVTHVRGVPCVADDIVVTSGASDALALLLRQTLRDGGALALENPGYPVVAHIASVDQVPLVPLSVDAEGASVAELHGSPSTLVVHVTPSHQFPLGVELSAERRAALIEWADARGGLVIENDYDGEFRFGAGAEPPLTALDRTGCVCLVGTFSRLLAPSLRVGYIVATPPLAERIAALKLEIDGYAAMPAQLAVAHLIRAGEVERHLRRARRLAARKRAAIRSALDPLDGVELHGWGGGLHVRIELTDGRDAAGVAARLQTLGIHVDQLRRYFWQGPERNALLLDYSGPDLSTLDCALGVIAGVLAV